MSDNSGQDYYTLLGVGYEAPTEEIRAAYRRLRQQAQNDPKRLALLSEALLRLQDPASRKEYDRKINVPLRKSQRGGQGKPEGQPPSGQRPRSSDTVFVQPTSTTPAQSPDGSETVTTAVSPGSDATQVHIAPPVPLARLEIVYPDGKQEERPLRAGATTIGRSHSCDIIFVDEYVSRQHARVVEEAGCFYVVDCGSKNGTWIRGERLSKEQRAALKDGDVFLIERRKCTLHIGKKPL